MINRPVDNHAGNDNLRCEIVVEAVLPDTRELDFVVPDVSRKRDTEMDVPLSGTASVLIGRMTQPLRTARSASMNTGDRVAVCLSRGSEEVHAGLAGSVIGTDAAHLFPLPQAWPLERAVASAPLAFAVRALRASRTAAGDSCVVVGLSPAGLFAVQLLHELGAATIVSVDADSAKRNLALAFGATDAMSLEVFTSSVVVDSMSTFNQVFFMSTGNDLLMSSIRAVNHLGIVVVAGSTTEKDFVLSDYYREIIIKESTIIGVNRPAREDWLAAVSMLGRSTMQLQEPSPAISGANAWHRRLNERADSGFVFAPIRTVLE